MRLLNIPTWLVPSITAILKGFAENWSQLAQNSVATIIEVAYGFGLALILGCGSAILISVSPTIRSLLMPTIVFFQTIPKSAIAPLFMVWFGFGMLPKVLVVLLISFFPIVVNFAAGLNSMSVELNYLAKSMGASPTEVFLKFRIPQALPMLFQSLKISVTLALIGAIVAEFVGANAGLGYLLLVANGQLDTPLLFDILIVLAVMGAILFYLVEFLERVMIPWHVSVRIAGIERGF